MLKNILKGKVIFLGIGNTLRGDDGFGPALVEKLRNETEFTCIDAGSAPQNYTGKIIKENPDTIIIADAVHLDQAPGEYEILKKDDILKSGFTTHDLSPNMFIEYLEKETTADIYMLAVQPKNMSFGEEMSESVKKAVEEILEAIKEAINA
ncbi:MAG: hydrogenase maturation peptidase HycI [Candidatus Omnitrophota bacterium]